MPDSLGGLDQRFSQPAGACPIALQKMEGHALRRLRPYTGQTTQRTDQLLDERALAPAPCCREDRIRTAA